MNVVQNKKATKRKTRAFRGFINFDVRNEADPGKIINQQMQSKLNSTSGNSSSINETAVTSSSLSAVVLAVTEGRGQARGEVGLAALDMQSPVLVLCQLSDSIHYTDAINKIQILNPVKLLLPDTIVEMPAVSKLILLIKENFPNTPIVPVQRRHFNDKSGLEQISRLCSRKSFNLVQVVSRKYYCLSAAGALLSYLKSVSLMNFAERRLKVIYQTKGGMMIDSQTSIKLELLYSLNTESRSAQRKSLYGLLNKCETAIGQRHLRANILEPPCDIDLIGKRQEQIKIFIENEPLQTELKETLKKFKNVENLLKVSCVPDDNDMQKALCSNIQLSLLLKNIMEAISPLASIVTRTVSDAFEHARVVLTAPVYREILQRLDSVVQANIHENRLAQKQFQYLFAVKAGANENIDLLRQLHSQMVDKIRAHVATVTEETELPLKMIYTPKLGFHLLLKNAKFTVKPPGDLELIHCRGSNTYLTTPTLIAFNDRTRIIERDLIRMSSLTFHDMLLEIAAEVDALYCLIAVIIELDIAQALAEVAMQEGFCCPSFSRVLRLEDAFHPLLQSCQRSENVIKNNVIATPQYNFFLITGPNMSGKTVYIKTIAIVQIMAQIGSFVPAKKAIIRMCDKVFSRIGFQDSFEQNASSFTVELRDMEYILSNLTPNSLVIIDELCRSTDPEEGQVLCYAFAEKLLNYIGVSYDDYFKIRDGSASNSRNINMSSSSSFEIRGANIKVKSMARPFIYMTTHFDDLAKLPDIFNNAVNLHMLVQSRMVEGKMRLDFKYKIQPGPSLLKSYGLALASMARFPTSLIDRAQEIMPCIREQSILDIIQDSNKTNSIGHNGSKKGNDTLSTTANMASTENLANEIDDKEPDVIDLFSHVLLQMNTVGAENHGAEMALINDKTAELIASMSSNLERFIKEANLGHIIAVLNSSSSRDESFIR